MGPADPTTIIKQEEETAQGCWQRELSVILPAYNEEESLGALLDQIDQVLQGQGIKREVIVVDDGSSDNTPDIARKKGAIVVQHEVNQGYGAALKTGVRQSRYGDLLIIDADGTYPPEAIPALLERFSDNDMVVGVRGRQEASLVRLRRTAKWALRALASYCAGVRILDLNSGMRLLKKDLVLSYFHLLPSGFSFTSTITLALHCNNHRVAYVPITYYPRGRSKFLPVRETVRILRQIIWTMTRLRPLKVFLPVSLFSLVPGLYVTVFQLRAGNAVSILPLLCILGGVLLGISGLTANWVVTKSKSLE
jgi:glycosyltransferase involved in cell wall biosynthesis